MKDTLVKNEIVERELKAANGFAVLFLVIILSVAAIAGMVFGIIDLTNYRYLLGGLLLGISCLWLCIFWIPLMGLKIIKPNEALVLTLFGKYYGTLKKDGFFFVNPFCTGINPAAPNPYLAMQTAAIQSAHGQQTPESTAVQTSVAYTKKLSLKSMTLVNRKQKVNDELGNPIEVGIVVIWKIVNPVKAVFNVDNYKEYVSTQADSALRDVVRLYPYDVSESGDEKSLRGSSQEVADKLMGELQKRVEIAGIEIQDTRITHLAYAPEIAAAMLQRQQATAIIEARQKIVEGAVGMVQMALNKLSDDNICELDEERKAAMVSNLLVVLCANKDAQPIVNSGSIY